MRFRFGENRWEQRSERGGGCKRKNRGAEQERKQRHTYTRKQGCAAQVAESTGKHAIDSAAAASG